MIVLKYSIILKTLINTFIDSIKTLHNSKDSIKSLHAI